MGITRVFEDVLGAQGRFTNEALDRRQAEAIFREHLASLQKRLINGYIALLEEVVSTAQFSAAWICLIEHHVHSSPSQQQHLRFRFRLAEPHCGHEHVNVHTLQLTLCLRGRGA